MKKTIKTILLVFLSLLLVTEVRFLGQAAARETVIPTEAVPVIQTPTQAPTERPTEPPTEPPTEAPTEPPTEAPSEPPVSYTLSFGGDCTLGTYGDKWYASNGFIQTIGKNYDHPFQNVREFFESDDLTVLNLEVVLADGGTSIGKLFTFRGPTAYSEILTGSSVEAVTIANNHAHDFGKAGYSSTKTVLSDAGIAYTEKDASVMITLDDGLVVGLYAVDGSTTSPIDEAKTVAGIQQLKEDGAELIIVAAHWGNEGEYRPTATQEKLGRAMIDAGAHIVYGHHPHVLQPIEAYNGGIIYYSMGNFCFGGHTNPKDKDSVLIQQEVIRAYDGSVTLGELTLIPCSISSASNRNNYQPTPCAEDSDMYKRILSKLDGSFAGSDLVVDYSKMNP